MNLWVALGALLLVAWPIADAAIALDAASTFLLHHGNRQQDPATRP